MAADLLVITEEVYENLVFENRKHLPFAGFDSMAERTITVSTAAKMFNYIGWPAARSISSLACGSQNSA